MLHVGREELQDPAELPLNLVLVRGELVFGIEVLVLVDTENVVEQKQSLLDNKMPALFGCTLLDGLRVLDGVIGEICVSVASASLSRTLSSS
jgi:hypothetical protein